VIEMTIEEWGNAIFTKKFKVLNIQYDLGMTIVLDVKTDIKYTAVYNGKTMQLEVTHDE